MTALIPVLLFGTKYILDLRTVNKVPTEKGNQEWHKHCAKEAALAVARNWNPGLTLEQQKAAVYKVADAVYSVSPFSNGSAIRRAIPGLDVKTSQIENQNDGTSNPLKVQYAIEEVPDNPIKYNYVARYRNKNSVSNDSAAWNPNYKLWRAIDRNVSNLNNRHSEYDEINKVELKKGNFVLKHHDICESPSITTLPAIGELCAIYEANGKYYPNNMNYSYNSNLSNYVIDELSDTAGSDPSIPEDDKIDFIKRETAFGAGPVRVSLENDQIKVETDADSGKNYPGTVATAVPAQCNVDIVLAIPVNGAANNENNRDAASDNSEQPMNSATSQYITSTPIYQMGQACKDFVKKFYHTRGVYMSLIPYSGKFSISPSRANEWTVPIPAFDNSSTNTQLMIGSCLYGTIGIKGAPLKQGVKNYSNTPYYWGNELTGYPIMCRQGLRIEQEDHQYGGNYPARGLLWDEDNTDPKNAEDPSYKYMRMNLNPCYIGYANMLSMQCAKQCTHFLPNPYYMIEPTADLVKIYEMCNALYPFYDPYNVSNFVFGALEWANNMFQGWTNDPIEPPVAGADENAVLSRESKTTPGRKKAVILLVNKPDWFEPGEMTYLGFDNDFSEVPVVESDKIDFSINYSNASKKYLDGTAYDGTPRGPKKIIRFVNRGGITRDSNTGHYECAGSGTGRLYFPHKGTVRLKVDLVENITVTDLGSCGISSYVGELPIAYDNNKVYVCAYDGSLVRYYDLSDNNWHTLTTAAFGSVMVSMVFSNGFLYANDYYGSNLKKLNLSSPTAWETCWSGSKLICSTLHNGKMYTINSSNVLYVSNSPGASPSQVSGKLESRSRGLCSYNGYIYNVNCDATSVNYYNPDTGTTGSFSIPSPATFYMGICYLKNKFYFVCRGGYVRRCNVDGSNFESQFVATKGSCDGICTDGVSKLYVSQCANNAHVYCIDLGFTPGTLQFTNINNDSTEYKITDEKTFTITPDQIYATSQGEYYIDFNVSNLRLISAEITNSTIANVCKPINVTYTDTDYGEVNITNTNTSTTSTVTETIDFAAGYDSCHVGKFMVDRAGESGDVKMNRTSGEQGYELNAADGGEIPCRIEADYPCDVQLQVEPVKSEGSLNTELATWTKVTAPGTVHPQAPLGNIYCNSLGWTNYGSIPYDGTKFVAINKEGYVATSEDGKTWTKAGNRPLSQVNSQGSWYSLSYDGVRKFVAINSIGYVATSKDGETWTKANGSQGDQPLYKATGRDVNWFSISYGGGKFVAINKEGYVATSTDGEIWEADDSQGDKPLYQETSQGDW